MADRGLAKLAKFEQAVDNLAKLGFDTYLSVDSMGKVHLHIWKLSEAEKRELEELQKWLKEEVPKLLEAVNYEW